MVCQKFDSQVVSCMKLAVVVRGDLEAGFRQSIKVRTEAVASVVNFRAV